MIRVVALLYTIIILTVPFGLAALPAVLATSLLARTVLLFLAPAVYATAYLLVCGLLSWPHRHAIRNGRFERSLADPVYGRRRLHAMCWTAVYYSPLYPFFLSIGVAKKTLFRLFGYRGSLNFTCYPDTWIRDLPILDVGEGGYLSNKATIGTNLALKDGRIMVEGITIGKRAMIGHLTMVAAGTVVGDDGEISHGTACGARVELGRGACVKADCCIDHKSRIGDEAEIGTRSYVGLAAIIGPGVKVPAGANIPRRARIRNQEDMDQYISSETRDLQELRRQLARLLDAAG